MLGLDISSTAVKLLELSRLGGEYRVEHHGMESLPENAVVEKNILDVQGVGEAIARLVSRSGTKVKQAAVAVAGSAVITRLIDMSADLDEREMEYQLQVEADRHIPYPLEEVALDFEVQGPSPEHEGRVEVLIAACRRENVEMREAALELGGLQAKIVDIEAHCTQRSCRLICSQLAAKKNDGRKVIAIVDIGATMTTLSVIIGGGMRYTREQLFGGRQLTEEIQRRYSLSVEQAELARKRGELPDDYEAGVLQPFRETVVRQVSRSLQFFYSSSDWDDVDHIILAGGVSAIVGLADMVSARLGAPCTLVDPFAGMSMSARVNRASIIADAPAMMVACGLAMRSFD